MFNLFGLRTISDLVLGTQRPISTSMVEARSDELPDDGLTMGTLYIGKQGSGKTTALARHLVDYFKRYPDRAMFVLDWNGGLSDIMLMMLKDDPVNLKRVVYDQLGNPEWVVPMPEFSVEYGYSYEEQIQRVADNIEKLNPDLVEKAPVLGGVAIKQIFPNFCRLITAMSNDSIDSNETWQITEVNRLMDDIPLLRKALAKYGVKVPDAQWFLTNKFLSQDIKPGERDMRTSNLSAILSRLDARDVRARLGYYRPGWTPREAIAKGQLVIVDGANMINRTENLDYLFTQVYSLIIAEINRRRSGNPNDTFVSIVLDEIKSLVEIPGMANDLFRLPSQYRSRRLQVYIVLQNLKQIAEEIRDQVWSLGNMVCFALFNFDDAYTMAQQLFRYDPKQQKLPALTDRQLPMMENDRGQYLEIANWIQRLNKRECIMRVHTLEAVMDKNVYHVAKTKNSTTLSDMPMTALDSLKDALLQQRAVRIRDALENINRRHQDTSSSNVRPTVDAM